MQCEIYYIVVSLHLPLPPLLPAPCQFGEITSKVVLGGPGEAGSQAQLLLSFQVHHCPSSPAPLHYIHCSLLLYIPIYTPLHCTHCSLLLYQCIHHSTVRTVLFSYTNVYTTPLYALISSPVPMYTPLHCTHCSLFLYQCIHHSTVYTVLFSYTNVYTTPLYTLFSSPIPMYTPLHCIHCSLLLYQCIHHSTVRTVLPYHCINTRRYNLCCLYVRI